MESRSSSSSMIDNLSEKLNDTEMDIRDLFERLMSRGDDDECELEEMICRFRDRFAPKTYSTPARRSTSPWPVEWTPEYSSRVKKKDDVVMKTPVRPVEKREMSTDLRRQVLLRVKSRLKSALKKKEPKKQSPEQIKSSIRKIEIELNSMKVCDDDDDDDTKKSSKDLFSKTTSKEEKTFERLVTRLTTPKRKTCDDVDNSPSSKRKWLREVQRRVKSIIASQDEEMSVETKEWLEFAEPRLNQMITEETNKKKGGPKSPGLQYFVRILESIRTFLKKNNSPSNHKNNSAFKKKNNISMKNIARRSLFLEEEEEELVLSCGER